MKIIPFDKLYNTEFVISEPMAKCQSWYQRGNIYNAIGKPKISHTLLWFKNCSAKITDIHGNILKVKRNQLAFMSKGTEYIVHFYDTNPEQFDTIVIHFQMTDINGEDIRPSNEPIICINNIDIEFSILIESIANEFTNNIVCIPKIKASIYQLLTEICKKEKKNSTNNEFVCIRDGIRLLEQNSDMKITDIADICGVSECYFRRLFKKYSGESPMDFRQHYRIEKAKKLLLSDEDLTIAEISEELNFADMYHFSKTFKKYTGLSPINFLKNYERKI